MTTTTFILAAIGIFILFSYGVVRFTGAFIRAGKGPDPLDGIDEERL